MALLAPGGLVGFWVVAGAWVGFGCVGGGLMGCGLGWVGCAGWGLELIPWEVWRWDAGFWCVSCRFWCGGGMGALEICLAFFFVGWISL